MNAVIRRYTVDKGKVWQVIGRVDRRFVPLLRRIPGFRNYYLIDDGGDRLASISVFDTPEGADESTRLAEQWIDENIASLLTDSARVISGEVRIDLAAGQPEDAETLDAMTRVAREMWEAFNRRDFEAMVRNVASDAEIVNPGTGEVTQGPGGLRGILERWVNAFPDAESRILNIAAAGQTVLVEYLGVGTHAGTLTLPGGAYPATGRYVEVRMCDVLHFEGDRITRIDTYYDSLGVARQIDFNNALSV